MSRTMRKVIKWGAAAAVAASVASVAVVSSPSLFNNSRTTTASAKRVRHSHKRAHKARCHYAHSVKGRAKRLYNIYTKTYHLNRKQAAVLTGLAWKESDGIHPTAHEAGGGAGYGLYQVNSRKSVRNWCHRHHTNYKTIRGQVAYYYHNFVKPSGFTHAKGSISHLAKLAEVKIQRSAIPAYNITARRAGSVLRITARK